MDEKETRCKKGSCLFVARSNDSIRICSWTKYGFKIFFILFILLQSMGLDFLFFVRSLFLFKWFCVVKTPHSSQQYFVVATFIRGEVIRNPKCGSIHKDTKIPIREELNCVYRGTQVFALRFNPFMQFQLHL